MPAVEFPARGDPRERAARTKRDRTRAALLEAAERQFGTRGWSRTRVEDIASDAGVSAATAYNHFPTKHVLIATVFRPLVLALTLQAERDVAAGRPVVEALVDQVQALVRTVSRYRMLASAYLVACQEYASRTHAPPCAEDVMDPRTLAPVPDAVRVLVEHGQATGELRACPGAEDISGLLTNLVLTRGMEIPHEPPEATAELLLTVLFGTLCPELLDEPGRAGPPGR